jgi:small subunit ribosomal protein S18
VPEPRFQGKPPVGGARRPGRWGGGKFAPKRKFCSFCASKVKCIDYKDTALLGRFISDRGKIEPRRRTGTCNRHQHTLAMAVKQARHIALLPFVPEHIHRQGQVPPLNLALPAPPKPEAEKAAAPPAEISAQS